MKSPRIDRIAAVPDPWHPVREETPEETPRQPVVSSDDRRARGREALAEMAGPAGLAVVDSMRDLAPDLADWIVDFSYGDVLSRPALDRRARELAAIGALAALGHATPQLRVHVEAALNVGCTRAEILEVILQTAVFAGFPAAINALAATREVFSTTRM